MREKRSLTVHHPRVPQTSHRTAGIVLILVCWMLIALLDITLIALWARTPVQPRGLHRKSRWEASNHFITSCLIREP